MPFIRREVVGMKENLYATIGYTVVWIFRYIILPVTIAVLARVIADRLPRPQPERQKKRRTNKTRLISK